MPIGVFGLLPQVFEKLRKDAKKCISVKKGGPDRGNASLGLGIVAGTAGYIKSLLS